MANVVFNTIRVIGNGAVARDFNDIFYDLYSTVEGLEYANFLPDWDQEDSPSKEWMADNIGSNNAWVSWMTDDSNISPMAIVRSDWTHVIPFAGILAHRLRDLDDNVWLEVTYVDEMLNFAGIATWHSGKWGITEKDANYWRGWSKEEVETTLQMWLIRRETCL